MASVRVETRTIKPQVRVEVPPRRSAGGQRWPGGRHCPSSEGASSKWVMRKEGPKGGLLGVRAEGPSLGLVPLAAPSRVLLTLHPQSPSPWISWPSHLGNQRALTPLLPVPSSCPAPPMTLASAL